MRLPLTEFRTTATPEGLAEGLRREPDFVLLRSALFDPAQARYSFVAARPFLRFRSHGLRCEIHRAGTPFAQRHYGNPWHVLQELLRGCKLPEQVDVPLPLGGGIGFWGYGLGTCLEPRLTDASPNDLGLPDCHVGFYDSLVAFDHHLGKSWIVSTGLSPDGTRRPDRAEVATRFWQAVAAGSAPPQMPPVLPPPPVSPAPAVPACSFTTPYPGLASSLSREDFIGRTQRAQEYIRQGHIYQVNLSHRLTAAASDPWHLFQALTARSPAPFAAFLNCGDFQLASSSPESFLRMTGRTIQTRPIKGTRPRSPDPIRDAQLAYELQTSSKELAELIMITDLLRNDLGKSCEFGSVSVPDLARLERFAHVQHLVSTVRGRLRSGVSHLDALASAFPGGSITGAPKIRAMQIIDELEPVARGPYTGALGYLGFNDESHLAVIIRTAVCTPAALHFHVGAGIVADSEPEAEYRETLDKAGGFLDALKALSLGTVSPPASLPSRK